MSKLSEHVRGCLRLFAFWLTNGTLQVRGLEWVDYKSHLEWPSTVEQTFAIWSNIIEFDDHGNVLNEEQAKHRAAQYIRQFADQTYVVDPPFEDWELELHL